ncbi:hypothetical protein CBS115989_8789 [Aspergillus niger]|uniref:Differential expressed Arsa-48 from patent US2003215950-A1-Aspergillus niger n=4 Tax=Aspergillus niger TaxID=5061 RepID=A2QL30_ASPNC|nr:differential expressed Arsa-48 from patent US2003215950-A1-Aspergillus niger [Aspergillus niger]EHA25633.1 hypothetical protein ASPNIDRAFT_43950 [Aspergillus niger ATCC 1015]RDH14728.1 hypothetical protein M747DRAFT_299951 [Aspergillus niger ATCC 13496]KAI2814165.1 hypothetical protein CBS115989_8789 [Aspergillus niger]KAI2825929.1 hypothetical protein CBS133816_7998 [Aspergillus niger]KAI2843302.1 hypothetical protein CBS11232_8307 [Aspergillus niger]|eukprot:XP_001390803.1 hypothetical protein ANI_1_296044 [Aspergillus niger CBS 513.88]
MQWTNFLCPLIAMQASLSAAWGTHVKRGSETNATLFAYGQNSSAYPIAYGLSDGLLYIAQDPENTAADLTPMSWDLPSITDECWIVNGTFMNGTRAGSLYIRPDSNNCLGVLPFAQAKGVNGVVTGFGLFASQLVYNNDTQLEAQFWASKTDTEDVYKLVWVEDSSQIASESFPVVVKASEDST